MFFRGIRISSFKQVPITSISYHQKIKLMLQGDLVHCHNAMSIWQKDERKYLWNVYESEFETFPRFFMLRNALLIYTKQHSWRKENFIPIKKLFTCLLSLNR